MKRAAQKSELDLTESASAGSGVGAFRAQMPHSLLGKVLIDKSLLFSPAA